MIQLMKCDEDGHVSSRIMSRSRLFFKVNVKQLLSLIVDKLLEQHT